MIRIKIGDLKNAFLIGPRTKILPLYSPYFAPPILCGMIEGNMMVAVIICMQKTHTNYYP